MSIHDIPAAMRARLTDSPRGCPETIQADPLVSPPLPARIPEYVEDAKQRYLSSPMTTMADGTLRDSSAHLDDTIRRYAEARIEEYRVGLISDGFESFAQKILNDGLFPTPAAPRVTDCPECGPGAPGWTEGSTGHQDADGNEVGIEQEQCRTCFERTLEPAPRVTEEPVSVAEELPATPEPERFSRVWEKASRWWCIKRDGEDFGFVTTLNGHPHFKHVGAYSNWTSLPDEFALGAYLASVPSWEPETQEEAK